MSIGVVGVWLVADKNRSLDDNLYEFLKMIKFYY